MMHDLPTLVSPTEISYIFYELPWVEFDCFTYYNNEVTEIKITEIMFKFVGLVSVYLCLLIDRWEKRKIKLWLLIALTISDF